MIASILISSSLDIRIKEINKILNTLDIRKNHPDLLYFPIESKHGIETAREIKKHFSTKPFQLKGKAVVLEDAANLSSEAQNAILKTLEEPPVNAILILGASSDAKLLPTILSRCQIIRIKGIGYRGVGDIDSLKDIEQLLKSTTQERFEFIEKTKDREELLKLIIQYFHHNLDKFSDKENINLIKELVKAERLSAQNVNIRAILEYLMLVIPQML